MELLARGKETSQVSVIQNFPFNSNELLRLLHDSLLLEYEETTLKAVPRLWSV